MLLLSALLPAAYWSTYTYGAIGKRKTKIENAKPRPPTAPLSTTTQFPNRGASRYTTTGPRNDASTPSVVPVIGKFISVDPLLDAGNPAQANAYVYSANNPMTFSDPTGMFWGDLANAVGWAGEQQMGITKRVVSSAYGTVKDVATAVRHPIQTGKGLKDFGTLAVTHPLEAGKQVFHAAADEAIRDFKNGNYGEAVGDAGWGVFEVVLGTKGITKVAKVAQVTKSSRVTQLCSFSGATLVLMGDGTKKPIKRIRVGDKVTATDPVTGKQSARKVTRLWVHQDTLTKLKVGKHRITTTEDHPFWSVTDKMFERADELARGERVLTASGGTVRVKGLQAGTARTGTAYNLTVKGLHTYHIGVPEILVHNTGANCGIGPVLKGQAGVNAVVAELEAAGWDISKEITIEAGGVRTRSDIYAVNPRGRQC